MLRTIDARAESPPVFLVADHVPLVPHYTAPGLPRVAAAVYVAAIPKNQKLPQRQMEKKKKLMTERWFWNKIARPTNSIKTPTTSTGRAYHVKWNIPTNVLIINSKSRTCPEPHDTHDFPS